MAFPHDLPHAAPSQARLGALRLSGTRSITTFNPGIGPAPSDPYSSVQTEGLDGLSPLGLNMNDLNMNDTDLHKLGPVSPRLALVARPHPGLGASGDAFIDAVAAQALKNDMIADLPSPRSTGGVARSNA